MFQLFTIVFIVGLVGGSFLPYLPLTIGLLLALAALGLTVLERHGRLTARHSALLFAGLLAGVLYWTFFIWAVTPDHVPVLNGKEPTTVTGTIVEPVRHAPDRAVMVLALSHLEERGSLRAIDGRLRLTWREPDLTVREGNRITVETRLKTPSGMMNPGG
ncbi:MAG TPA: ComEC/Rec2 family competence protein, partial [Nitrospiraceae bacterium]|nr:ComEC/Rec2 family competence protein [Nitrospiraceae bacterium]